MKTTQVKCHLAWKEADGWHVCTLTEGHEGPHRCGGGAIHAGQPLYYRVQGGDRGSRYHPVK